MTKDGASDPRTVLTIDLGTQSLRVSALSTAGERLWTWRRPITSTIDGDIFEQDPAEWLAAVEDGMREAAKAGIRPDAVVATGPLAGFVALDEDGVPLTRAVMYSDRRSAADLPMAEQAIARDGLPETAGLRAYVPDPLPHALRLRRMEPEIAAGTRHLLDATGFLAHALSGQATLNPHTALRLHGGGPARALGIDPALFGRPTRLTDIIGTLRPELAARFGFAPVPIVAATFDSKCAYVASGIARPGEALDISGTVTSFGVIADRPLIDPLRRIYAIPFGDHWLVRGSTASSGASSNGHGASSSPATSTRSMPRRRRSRRVQAGCYSCPITPENARRCGTRMHVVPCSACPWTATGPQWRGPSMRASPSRCAISFPSSKSAERA